MRHTTVSKLYPGDVGLLDSAIGVVLMLENIGSVLS